MNTYSFTKDLTEFFRNSLQTSGEVLNYLHEIDNTIIADNLPEVIKRMYIFNNSIIRIGNTEFFLMSCRLFLPYIWRNMKTADLPTMWGPIYIPKMDDHAPTGWDGKFPHSAVFLCKLIDSSQLKFDMIATKLLTSDMIQYPGSTLKAEEDIRLYEKSDGKYYLYYSGGHMPCDIGESSTYCMYLAEIGITLNQQQVGSKINIQDFEFDLSNHKIICENAVQELAAKNEPKFFIKNWSPWVYKGVDYLTDWIPDYIIYQRDVQSRACQLKNIQPNMLSLFKELKKYYTITLSSGESLKLFQYATTTPSIPIPDNFTKTYLKSNCKNLYVGVAHIRSQMGSLLHQDPETFKMRASILSKIRKAIKTETFYDSYTKFLNMHVDLRSHDKLYAHPDFYLMMLYFFNPLTGSIKYTSTAFLPVSYHNDNINMRLPLVFPCGLFATSNTLYISYGEGDVKCRLMRLGRDSFLGRNSILGGDSFLRIIKYDEDYVKNFKFQNFMIPSINFDEKRTVGEIANSQF